MTYAFKRVAQVAELLGYADQEVLTFGDVRYVANRMNSEWSTKEIEHALLACIDRRRSQQHEH